MGKTKSSFRQFTQIIFNLSSLLIITLIITTISFLILLFNNKQLENETSNLKTTLNNLKLTYDDELEKIEQLESEISEIKDIENNISKLKNSFFAKAKEYENIVLAGGGTKKIAYLTIDDGPYDLTVSFLDTLAKYDVLATFFLLGKPNDRYDAIYKRIYNDGHTLANHTYYHNIKSGLYTNTDSFINNVLKQENFLQEKVGVKTNILRFPGGSTTASTSLRSSIINRLRTLGYGYIDWNVSSGDGGGNPTVSQLYNNVINNTITKRVAVILMHDYSYNTLTALPSIIEELNKRDYILLPLFYESQMVKK